MNRESRRSYYNNRIPAGSVCALCGGPAENVDHIVALGIANRLGEREYRKASQPTNLQFVCVACHKVKSREDRWAMAFLDELERRKRQGGYTCHHCQREFAVAIYLYECPCTIEMKEYAETGFLSEYLLPPGLLRELQESGRLWELPRRSSGIADYHWETRRRYTPLAMGNLGLFQSTQWIDGVIRKTFEDEEWVEQLHYIAKEKNEEESRRWQVHFGQAWEQRWAKKQQQVEEGTAHAIRRGTCESWSDTSPLQSEVVFCKRKAVVRFHDGRKMCRQHKHQEEQREAQLQITKAQIDEYRREREELRARFLAAREARLAAKAAS